jgi:hypothetical protein
MYVRTSKQRICWHDYSMTDDRELQPCEEMFCCFLPALQESTSLKQLHISMEMPRGGGPSSLALENMIAHTQALRSLSCVLKLIRFFGDD